MRLGQIGRLHAHAVETEFSRGKVARFTQRDSPVDLRFDRRRIDDKRIVLTSDREIRLIPATIEVAEIERDM